MNKRFFRTVRRQFRGTDFHEVTSLIIILLQMIFYFLSFNF